MANEEHLRILKQGNEAWNDWRWKNPDIVPDLVQADLAGAHLNAARLNGAKLIEAYLFEHWQHERKADVIAKVIGDFSAWDRDAANYEAALLKLMKALQPEADAE